MFDRSTRSAEGVQSTGGTSLIASNVVEG
jgi:hypothetical protein